MLLMSFPLCNQIIFVGDSFMDLHLFAFVFLYVSLITVFILFLYQGRGTVQTWEMELLLTYHFKNLVWSHSVFKFNWLLLTFSFYVWNFSVVVIYCPFVLSYVIFLMLWDVPNEWLLSNMLGTFVLKECWYSLYCVKSLCLLV